jgi:hypothetical protein
MRRGVLQIGLALTDSQPPGARVHSTVQQQELSAPRRIRNHALASFAATAVLTSMIRIAQAIGYTRMDLPLMLGTTLTPDRDRAKMYGFLVHMANGWLFSAVYVAAFQSLRRSGVLLGMVVGIVHGIFVLVTVIPLLPGAHGRMASDFTGPQPTTRLEPPGFMALNYGRRTPIVTLVAHAVYGGLLGGFYKAGSTDSGDGTPSSV